MGGRGASSMSARVPGKGSPSGLPGGAVAFSAVYADGRKVVFSVGEGGRLMRSQDETLALPTPVGADLSVAEAYERARSQGYETRLLSQSDVDSARRSRAVVHAANERLTTQWEVKGTRETRRLSKLQGRVRSSRRR